MTISTRKRFRFLAAACALCVAGLLMQGVVYGVDADSAVPSVWNTVTKEDGAYREAFEGAKVTWGGTELTPVLLSYSFTLSPSRTNDFFASPTTHTKVLTIDTAANTSVANTLALGTKGSGVDVSFKTDAVYADMRVKFDAMAAPPNSSLLTAAKLAIYADSDGFLYAKGSGSAIKSVSSYTLANWHQLTVKMKPGATADVYIDNASTPVFPGVPLNNVTPADSLKQVAFSGTGYIDDLYVSYGNPAYAGVPGNLKSTSDAVATWISGKINGGTLNANATFDNFNSPQLEQAYLLNALGADKSNPQNLGAPTFGIQSFELTSPTTLSVTLYLKVGNTAKDGTINGRLQLRGKVLKTDTDYTVISSATVTPGSFNNGTATVTFDITDHSDYKFFKPTIIE